MNTGSIDKRMSIVALALPIWGESFLRMLFMSVDVFMLSAFSDKAVAAVGLISQFGFFIFILFMMVSSGVSILISQYNGARQQEDAADAVIAGTILSLLFGVVLSFGLFLFSRQIIAIYALEPEVAEYAFQYLFIFGSFSFTTALNSVFTAVMRAYGFTRQPMLINMGANVLNVIGNYLFIFGPFGIPVLGVTGVAISTVVSRGIGSLVMLFWIIRCREIPFEVSRIKGIKKAMIREILRYGVPNGGEYLSFNMAQMVTLWAISRMGSASLSAYSYSQSIIRFALLTPSAIGQAVMILSGYLIGAGKEEEAYRRVLKYYRVSILIALAGAGLIALFRFPLVGIFTDNPEIIALTAPILFYSLVYEPGRTANLVVISGLKGAGDVRFPVYTALITTWIIAVGGSYLLGLGLGVGIIGVFIAFSADEWLRGLIMIGRWRSRKWVGKAATADR